MDSQCLEPLQFCNRENPLNMHCQFVVRFFVEFFWRTRVCWPLLCLCRPFCIFKRCLDSSVADPGCLSRIPDPTFFHPGSRICIKEFNYFNPKKWFLSSMKYGPGCSSRIRILTFYPSRIPDPGVKKAPDPGSGSSTLLDSSPEN